LHCDGLGDGAAPVGLKALVLANNFLHELALAKYAALAVQLREIVTRAGLPN
jgi:hypothetical protein